MSGLFEMMREVIEENDAIHNACHDLWTWLPQSAGESEPPPPAEIISSACDLLAYLAGYDRVLTMEQQDFAAERYSRIRKSEEGSDAS